MIHRSKTALRAILPKNSFARGVSVLVGGTAGAQLISVLAAPLLTRLFTPDDFGLLAVYASLLALMGVVSSLRYELAIPLPEDDVEAANIAVLSLLLVALTTMLSGVVVAILAKPIAGALGVPALAGYLWLLPVGVLLGGCYTVFNYWCVRTKLYSTIASTRIRQSLATLAIQLAAFKLGGLALLLGQVAGQSAGTTTLARPALALPVFRQVSWHAMKTALRRYKQFPMYSVPGGFLNTAGRQLPPVIIAAFYGPLAAGIYSLANRIAQLPVSLLAGSIYQVFLPEASRAAVEGRLKDIFLEFYAVNLKIFTLPLVIFAILAYHSFGFFFGGAWSESGLLAAILTPWVIMVALTSPISSIEGILGRQKGALIFEVVLVAFRLGLLLVGLNMGDTVKGVSLFVVGAVIGIFFKNLWLGYICGVRPRSILKLMLKEFGLALLVGTLGFYLIFYVPISIAYIAMLFMAGAVFTRSIKILIGGIKCG